MGQGPRGSNGGSVGEPTSNRLTHLAIIGCSGRPIDRTAVDKVVIDEDIVDKAIIEEAIIEEAMDGVAVTRRITSAGQCRTAAGLIVAAALLAGGARPAAAENGTQTPQANPAPAAASPGAGPQPSPSRSAAPQSSSAPPLTPVLTLPPQPPPPQLPSQASSAPAAPPEKRGFLNELGQWWNESIANWNAKLKEQQSKLDEFNKEQSAAMKSAADAVVRFSSSKVIETQQLCPVAGNGAPDCATAATSVCKGKGFSSGQPIDIRTAERCKASLWVSGDKPTPANCPVETVLLRVACQQ